LIAATGGDVSALAAKAATTTIPIVFTAGGDAVMSGLVSSINRPGGNITGVNLLYTEMGAKRLELLRILIPNATTIAMLVNPNNPTASADQQEVLTGARSIGAQISIFAAGGESDFERIFANMVEQKIQALPLEMIHSYSASANNWCDCRLVMQFRLSIFHASSPMSAA
jgi:putative ABC transport system substrate-binding protein